jgi:hypothetical protein
MVAASFGNISLSVVKVRSIRVAYMAGISLSDYTVAPPPLPTAIQHEHGLSQRVTLPAVSIA